MSYASQVRLFDRTTPPHPVTLVLMAGLSALTMTIFLPALPAMTAYFDTDYALMQLSVAVYLAVNAVLQIVIGPMSDKWGRRPVTLAGTALFCWQRSAACWQRMRGCSCSFACARPA